MKLSGQLRASFFLPEGRAIVTYTRCCESPGKGLDVRAEFVSAVEIQDSMCVVSRFMELANSGLSRCAEPSILCTNS